MQTVKVLKRKDAASVVVAVVIAFFAQAFIAGLSANPVAWFSNGATNGWNDGLWRPIITFVVEVIILEIVIRLYVWLNETSSRQVGKK